MLRPVLIGVLVTASAPAWLESPDGVYNASVAHDLEWYERKGLPSLLCGIAKVGITNMAAAGFRLVRRHRRLREKLADPAFARAVLVRSPFERFASFYRNKIQMIATYRNRTLSLDPATHVRAYNALLLDRANDSTAHAPRAYALALWATGDTRAVEGHVRSMTATCLLDCVRFDVVGALEDTADFARRMRGEGGEGFEWPHVHSNALDARAARVADFDCVTREAIFQAYWEDFAALAAHQPRAPPVARAYGALRCSKDQVLREVALSDDPLARDLAARIDAFDDRRIRRPLECRSSREGDVGRT